MKCLQHPRHSCNRSNKSGPLLDELLLVVVVVALLVDVELVDEVEPDAQHRHYILSPSTRLLSHLSMY